MFRHGDRTRFATTPEYTAWVGMVHRCISRWHKSYKRYGGRGITVCREWQQPRGLGFLAFLAHVGRRPSAKHSLDRIDNTRGYVPGNVRWTTMRVQGRNRSTNRRLTLNGVTLCIAEWAERLGMRRQTLGQRLAKGWPIEKALTTPKEPRRPRARRAA